MGSRPADSPSLADDDNEFQRLADRLWGKRSAAAKSMRKVGKGRVYTGMSANEVLAALGVARDWEYTKPEADTTLMFLHRKLDDGEVYFVDNRGDRAEIVDATFRVDGKAPELWDAVTGVMQPVSYRIADGRTTVPLHLDPYGTAFVMFRKPATETTLQLPAPKETVIGDVDDALNRDWKGWASSSGKVLLRLLEFSIWFPGPKCRCPLQMKGSKSIFLGNGHLFEDDRHSGGRSDKWFAFLAESWRCTRTRECASEWCGSWHFVEDALQGRCYRRD